jgi:hypothetical protein
LLEAEDEASMLAFNIGTALQGNVAHSRCARSRRRDGQGLAKLS